MIRSELHFSRKAEPACRRYPDARPDRGAGTVRRLGRALLAGLVVFIAVAPAGAADVINGSRIYARHCAACHGPSGMSVMPGAPHLARGERMMQSDLTLLATLKSGRTAMPAYFGILTDSEIHDVIAYSRTLR